MFFFLIADLQCFICHAVHAAAVLFSYGLEMEK